MEAINNIVLFLNSNEGALMIVITFVYVVATIMICIFNGSSARATREQVSESQRQFEETKRLTVMPYIEFTTMENRHSCFVNADLASHDSQSGEYNVFIQIKNIGIGTAQKITYTYKYKCGTMEDNSRGLFPVIALGPKESNEIHIDFGNIPAKSQENIEVDVEMKYSDLLENEYVQKIGFSFVHQDIQQNKYRCISNEKYAQSTPILFKK